MIIYYFSLYLWCLRRPRRARGIASSPYALLGFSYYPFVTPGTACQGAVTAGGAFDCVLHYWWAVLRYLVDMVALLPCSDHAIVLLGRGRSIVACERSSLAAYFSGFVLSHGRWGCECGDIVFAGPLLDPLLAQLLCLTRGGWLRGCCQSLSNAG